MSSRTKDGYDSVSEVTVANRTGITVTAPAGTVYNVGDEVVYKKGGEIEVMATYDGGTTRKVSGTITSDTSGLTQSAGIVEVMVNYTEGESTQQTSFPVVVFPAEVKILTDYSSPYAPEGEWTYVAFGEWPQTKVEVKAGSLTQVQDGRGNTRIRVPTDYAKATGAYQSSVDGYGGRWWLRSPSGNVNSARRISNSGSAISVYTVNFTDAGVVPALCIKLQ